MTAAEPVFASAPPFLVGGGAAPAPRERSLVLFQERCYNGFFHPDRPAWRTFFARLGEFSDVEVKSISEGLADTSGKIFRQIFFAGHGHDNGTIHVDASKTLSLKDPPLEVRSLLERAERVTLISCSLGAEGSAAQCLAYLTGKEVVAANGITCTFALEKDGYVHCQDVDGKEITRRFGPIGKEQAPLPARTSPFTEEELFLQESVSADFSGRPLNSDQLSKLIKWARESHPIALYLYFKAPRGSEEDSAFALEALRKKLPCGRKFFRDKIPEERSAQERILEVLGAPEGEWEVFLQRQLLVYGLLSGYKRWLTHATLGPDLLSDVLDEVLYCIRERPDSAGNIEQIFAHPQFQAIPVVGDKGLARLLAINLCWSGCSTGIRRFVDQLALDRRLHQIPLEGRYGLGRALMLATARDDHAIAAQLSTHERLHEISLEGECGINEILKTAVKYRCDAVLSVLMKERL